MGPVLCGVTVPVPTKVARPAYSLQTESASSTVSRHPRHDSNVERRMT